MRRGDTTTSSVACGWCRGGKFYVACIGDRISLECVTCRAKTYKRHAGWIAPGDGASKAGGSGEVIGAPKAVESRGYVSFDVVSATQRKAEQGADLIIIPINRIETDES